MYREKSGSKILIVIMFVIVAAAISGAAVYYYAIGKTEVDKKKLAEELDNVKKENEQLKAENEQLKAAGTEQSTETKTYTNKKDGYTFEYPANWFVTEDTEGTIVTNFKYPQENGTELAENQTKIVINLKNNPQKMTPKTWAANTIGDQTTIIKKEELKVGEKDAYKMKTKGEMGNVTSVYVAKSSTKMLEIINYGNDLGLTKIIESLKFI